MSGNTSRTAEKVRPMNLATGRKTMKTRMLLRAALWSMLIMATAVTAGCAITAPGHDPHGPGNSENAHSAHYNFID